MVNSSYTPRLHILAEGDHDIAVNKSKLVAGLIRSHLEQRVWGRTGDRDYTGAKASIDRSLTRMGVEQIDLIQFHNLTDDAGWERAMSEGRLIESLRSTDEGGNLQCALLLFA